MGLTMTAVHNFRASHHCSKSVSAVQLYSPCPRYYFKFLTKFLFHIIYIYKSFLQQLLGCYRRHSNPTLLFLCLHSLHLRRFLFRGRLILSTYFSQNSCTLWFACMPFAVRVNHSKLFKPSAQLNKPDTGLDQWKKHSNWGIFSKFILFHNLIIPGRLISSNCWSVQLVQLYMTCLLGVDVWPTNIEDYLDGAMLLTDHHRLSNEYVQLHHIWAWSTLVI